LCRITVYTYDSPESQELFLKQRDDLGYLHATYPILNTYSTSYVKERACLNDNALHTSPDHIATFSYIADAVIVVTATVHSPNMLSVKFRVYVANDGIVDSAKDDDVAAMDIIRDERLNIIVSTGNSVLLCF
jgi:hypothetical protein